MTTDIGVAAQGTTVSWNLDDITNGYGVVVTRTLDGDITCTCVQYQKPLGNRYHSRFRFLQRYWGAKRLHGCQHVDYVVEEVLWRGDAHSLILQTNAGVEKAFGLAEQLAAAQARQDDTDHGRKHVELARRVGTLEQQMKTASRLLRQAGEAGR